MKTLCFATFAVLALSIKMAVGQQDPGNPLNGLEKLKNFETMRASSSDPLNHNKDSRPIEPGGTLTLGEFEGPGEIVHIWCTISHQAPNYSRLLTLRIYWDGEEHPSVECPIGDFFGVGMGVDKSFTSLPIRVSSEGRGRNCYWPMPFRKSARITVTNESDKRCNAVYYYIDWQKYSSLPKDSAYFHAMYRQEFPCVMGHNYLIADIEGRGHYVGTVLSVCLSSPGWFGEGNDFFYIDGAKEPSLKGTGTEDYFCDGWGFREQSGPYYGTPLWEGDDTGDRGSAYRFHIPDPVVFTKSLRVEIEHKGWQKYSDHWESFLERDDLMSSVAFWYQVEPHKPWPALPSGPERLPFYESTLINGHEAVNSVTNSEHDQVEIQPLYGVTDGKQLWFKPTGANGWLEIPFQFETNDYVRLFGKMVHAPDYGIYRVKLDGKEIARVDLYSQEVTPTAHNWGWHELKAGSHTLRFECIGKSPNSSGYFLGFDALAVRIPVYYRPAGVDLRSLQKVK